MIYHGRTGASYTLGSRLGSGGEGEVYEVVNNPAIVAKVYYDTTFSNMPHVLDGRTYLFKKISCMLDSNVSSYLGSGSNRILTVAWPMDLLLDGSNRFVGYTMPRVASRENLLTACAPSEQQYLTPAFSWKHSILIARNLALAVDYLHTNNVVVGDFNMNNVLVSPDCSVTMVDSDSFNITDWRTGSVFKCMVGVPESLAPELQGYDDLSQPGAVFTKESDRFSLAVHIWNLLMLCYDPFGAASTNWNKRSSSTNTHSLNIQKGLCPYVSIPRGSLPPHAPNTQLLPDYLRDLFDRVFTYDASSAVRQATIDRRPGAHEWCMALERLYAESLATCSKNSNHVYRRGLGFANAYGGCPWCEREGRVAVDNKNKNKSSVHGAGSVSGIGTNQGGSTVATSNVGTSTSGAPTIKRGTRTLFISFTLTGALFGLLIADSYLPAFRNAFPSIERSAVVFIMSVFGIAVGGILAFFMQEKHQTADSDWTWPMRGLLLVPATSFLASAALFLVGSLVVALLTALLPWLAIALMCLCCAYRDD